LIPISFLIIFYFYPLASIFIISFQKFSSGFLAQLYEIIISPSIRHILGFTIWQAFLSTIFTLGLGLPGAYVIARYKFPGKSILRAITGVPFVMPTLVVAAGFNALLGPKGWVNYILQLVFQTPDPPIQFINTFPAIIVAHVFYNTTIILRLVGDFWSHIDPRLGKTARILGANSLKVLTQVTLPILSPAIIAAALLVYIFNFTSFGVVLILGGPKFSTLEVEIYYQTISLFNLPTAAVLSILQLVFTLTLTVIYTRITNRITKPLKNIPSQFTQRRLNSWKARIIVGMVVISILLVLTSPLLALASQSIISLETRRDREGEIARGFTLDFYRELSKDRYESLFYSPPVVSIGISTGYALVTVILSLIIGLPAAWNLAGNRDSRINRFLDPVLMLPLGTSAVTLGLGFIVAFAHPAFDLRASPILIPLAHTLVAFPFVVRSLTPALRSIQPGLRQSAAVLGASPRNVIVNIDLPLIGRAVLVAAIFAFSISIGEFGATALIYRPEYPTLPMVIYRLLSRPGGLNYGQAIALSTILMGFTMIGMLIIERFRIADVGEF
jgi:thiamine transport system permease protein